MEITILLLIAEKDWLEFQKLKSNIVIEKLTNVWMH